MRRLFLCAVLSLAALAVASAAGLADHSTEAKPAKAAKAFDLLRAESDRHEMADAYLLAYASCYVFPELLGHKDRNDHKGFARKFADKFTPLGVRRIKYVTDTRSGTEVVILTASSSVVVVFRGSEFGNCSALIKDWLTNVKALTIPASELGEGARVHRGMWRALDGVYEDVAAEVAAREGFAKKKVYVTGHSLGGALALLCGVRLAKEGKGKATVYTFGSPRVGNHEFRRSANELTVHRWVHAKDVVCMMPSDSMMSYRHAGQTHNLTKKNHAYLDDRETRAVFGSCADHHIHHYLAGLHANLPDDVKGLLPEPPG